MGSWFSTDQPMFTIGFKTIRRSKMKTIKTYQDALRIMSLECKDDDNVLVVRGELRVLTPVYESFQIVDSLIFKGVDIPIRRLYGRQS
jgi:hypothetical protein